jgi:hypothetical protein
MNEGVRVSRSDTDEENRSTVKHATVAHRPQEIPRSRKTLATDSLSHVSVQRDSIIIHSCRSDLYFLLV